MKKIWFVRKKYGWGWRPKTWQGWITILIYLFFVFVFSYNLKNVNSMYEVFQRFLFPVIVSTIVLILICYRRGEKPKWQWGEENIEKK